MRKLIPRLVMLLASFLGAITAVGVTTQAPAAAQAPIVPCAGGSNGWFSGWNPNNGAVASFNCTKQGNHIVVDMHAYGSNGQYCWGNPYCSMGVVDLWYPSGLYVNVIQSYYSPLRLHYVRDGNGVVPAWSGLYVYADDPVAGPSHTRQNDFPSSSNTADQVQQIWSLSGFYPNLTPSNTGGFQTFRARGVSQTGPRASGRYTSDQFLPGGTGSQMSFYVNPHS